MKKTIRFIVTEDGLQRIARNAHNESTDVSCYIKHHALNPEIETTDFTFISEHTKLLKEIRKSVDLITNTIAIQGNYTQQEIDTVVSLMETTLSSQNELLKQVEERIHNDSLR